MLTHFRPFPTQGRTQKRISFDSPTKSHSVGCEVCFRWVRMMGDGLTLARSDLVVLSARTAGPPRRISVYLRVRKVNKTLGGNRLAASPSPSSSTSPCSLSNAQVLRLYGRNAAHNQPLRRSCLNVRGLRCSSVLFNNDFLTGRKCFFFSSDLYIYLFDVESLLNNLDVFLVCFWQGFDLFRRIKQLCDTFWFGYRRNFVEIFNFLIV